MNPNQIGEFGLIERWSRRLEVRPDVLLGIGDDAAILAAVSQPVVTCDALVEGVHFRLDWTTARALGRKAMAVNVSDVAAMGAQPVAAFVSIAVPTSLDVKFLDELYAGFDMAAREWQFTLAGGDTTRSPQGLLLSITMVGAVPEGRLPLRRSSAKNGDVILTTGTLGDAAGGLELLKTASTSDDKNHRYLLARHLAPTPRLREIESVMSSDLDLHLHAAIDLSDGLAGDAAHIARASGLAIEIEVSRLPISEPCRAVATNLGVPLEDWALYGGEDYELLLCVAPEGVTKVAQQITSATQTPVTAIGSCQATSRRVKPGSVVLCHPHGRRENARSGWTHF